MITAKEKARDLINKFYQLIFDIDLGSNVIKDKKRLQTARKCALIAVNYIISANPHSNPFNTTGYSTMEYWLEVKKEIETL